MPIRIKIARSAGEIDDVFHLRWHVYAQEEGYFGGVRHAPPHITDRFDAHPGCFNLIAYAGEEPIATLRLNDDTGGELPSETYWDFSGFRERAAAEAEAAGTPVRLASASMLAIRRPWRKRRDIFRALFKVAAALGVQHGTTHVIASVNHKSSAMYRRIGFRPLAGKVWIEEIGEHIVPMACSFADFHNWAFERLEHSEATLTQLAANAERLLYSAGEVIFREGDPADECYLVDLGTVRITRYSPHERRTLTLSTFGPGDLFGELALVDEQPRSATATATTNVEVVVIRRQDFRAQIERDPARAHELLQIFAERIRRTDELALMLAYGSTEERLDHALRALYEAARPSRQGSAEGARLVHAGPTELARTAGVDEPSARRYLERLAGEGWCEFSEERIRFMRDPGLRTHPRPPRH